MLNFFIERPVFSTVIALVMILVGVLAAVSLPIAQYPQVVPPQVTVTTSFPGANADVVAQSVAASIEQQVNGSQDMLYMSSKSGNDGSYSLTVTFDIGTDKNIDAIEVQNRVAIAQSQLPADVIRNGITVRKSTTDFLEVISLTSPERRYDAVFLSNYALLNLYDALGRVPGVGQVRIFGARDYSMRIWLNPERMARLGVTASDIANVVREQNVVAPFPKGSRCSTRCSSRDVSPPPLNSRTSSSGKRGTARSCASRTSRASNSPPPTTRSAVPKTTFPLR
jgi:HAE1 family hydrophobic/amphiphilic exporter-1/multidrug efflux pump